MTNRSASRALQNIFFLFALVLSTNSKVFAQNSPLNPIAALSSVCSWQHVTDDLDAADTSISFGVLSSARVYLYRTSMKRFSVQVIRAQRFGLRKAPVKVLCDLAHASICINASFFDEQYRPLGLLIEKGAQIQKIQKGGNLLTGIFQVSRDDASIVTREAFSSPKILEAVQAGPRLIENGSLVTGLKEEDVSGRRSGVCIDSEKRIIIYAVTAPLFGISIREVQKRLLFADIGCQNALNLDGGSSTQLSGQPFEIAGEDEVPVALGIFPIA